jgi:hypothetical protein
MLSGSPLPRSNAIERGSNQLPCVPRHLLLHQSCFWKSTHSDYGAKLLWIKSWLGWHEDTTQRPSTNFFDQDH